MKKNSKKNFGQENRTVKAYLSNIDSEKELNAAEMLELVVKAHNGDFEARNKLILANLNLVIRIASDYQNYGLPLKDLEQEGSVGLIEAVDKYDVTKGNVFANYARPLIRQRILKALEEVGRMVRLPHHEVTLLNKIKAYVKDFEQRNEEMPSDEEIAEYFQVSLFEVKYVMNAAGHIVELDAPLDTDDDESDTLMSTLTMGDDVEADTNLIREEEKGWLPKVMKNTLKERERYIVCQNYGIDCKNRTLVDLAQEMKLSSERVRQIEKGAEAKLKKALLKNNISTYANAA